MKVIFLALGVLTVVVSLIVSGVDIESFMDIHSFLMVFVLTILLMLSKFGSKALTFWKLEKKQRTKIAKWSGRTCLHVGFFGTLIGWIIIGHEVKSFSSFGPAFTVSLLTTFYSYFLYIFFFMPFASDDTD